MTKKKGQKPKKKDEVNTLSVWFLAESETNPGSYVSGIDGSGQPTFSTNINDVEWAPKQSTVDLWIERNNFQNVKSKGQGGNHPPKPPISA